jgi:glyoxylase-like metal-dependent hydrolase (beta-lactamase superfamily II)
MMAPMSKPRRWRRWLILFMAGNVLDVVVLWWRGRPLPAAPPHTRAPAQLERLGRARACWIELASGKSWGQFATPGFSTTGRWYTTASALLVRHPQGDVLIDAGNSRDFEHELAELRFFPRVYLRMAAGELKTRHPLRQELAALGVDPAALKWFIPSHAHLDHLGGVTDLPGVPVLAADEEIAFIERSSRARGVGALPAHARAIAGRTTPIRFGPLPYETFPESADLFGDGSVVLVRLPGHTPGSVGTFVNLGPGRRLLHVGDAVDLTEQLERRVGKSIFLQPTDDDSARAGRTVAELAELRQRVPDLAFLPAHDRPAWERVFGQPGRCLKGR